MKMTKKLAKAIIEMNKDNTNYFNNSMSRWEMFEMLRYRMNFGQAETETIIAALVLAGAKFKDEDENDK